MSFLRGMLNEDYRHPATPKDPDHMANHGWPELMRTIVEADRVIGPRARPFTRLDETDEPNTDEDARDDSHPTTMEQQQPITTHCANHAAASEPHPIPGQAAPDQGEPDTKRMRLQEAVATLHAMCRTVQQTTHRFHQKIQAHGNGGRAPSGTTDPTTQLTVPGIHPQEQQLQIMQQAPADSSQDESALGNQIDAPVGSSKKRKRFRNRRGWRDPELDRYSQNVGALREMANRLKGAVCRLGDQTRHRIDMIPHFAPPH